MSENTYLSSNITLTALFFNLNNRNICEDPAFQQIIESITLRLVSRQPCVNGLAVTKCAHTRLRMRSALDRQRIRSAEWCPTAPD